MTGFFISYTSIDRAWAEWIAWQLEEAGYSTIIHAWDFRPGDNFVLDMQRASAEAERTIVVLSPEYLRSIFAAPEWTAAFAKDPTSVGGVMLPVRVRDCNLKGLLPQIVYIDLVDQEETAARDTLLSGVQRGRVKPVNPPSFPGYDFHTVAKPKQYPGDITVSTSYTLVEENPFQTAGTLPEDSKVYIERQCDTDLMHLFKSESLIAVSGAYEIGKSSLLVRSQAKLRGNCKEWGVFFKDLTGMRTDNERLFMDAFFRILSEHLGKIDTWDDLVGRLRTQYTIFFLDEFGALSPDVAGAFVPRLCLLANEVSSHVRIIVALPEPIEDFFAACGIRNPRYVRPWHSISISFLDAEGVEALLRILPEPARSVALQYRTIIMDRSAGHPRRVQCLCSNLFEQAQAGRSEQELSRLIHNLENYT